MSRRSVFLSLSSIALAAVAGILWLRREPTPALVSAVEPPIAGRREATRAPSSSVLESAPRSAGESADGTQRSSAVETTQVTESDPELLEALWVEGRVVIPKGTPPDEHVEIVADGKRFDRRPLYRAPIRSDGSFRVAFAKGTETGFLTLEARYLHLENGRTIDATKPPKRLILEPRLGGVLRGRLVLTPTALSSRQLLVGSQVRVEGDQGGRFAKITEELTFEFLGLPAPCSYALRVEAPEFAPLRRDGVLVLPVQVAALDLEVVAGAKITGRVVDEKGIPIGRARVRAQTDFRSGFQTSHASGESSADGTFTITGLPTAPLTLTAEAEEFVEAQTGVEEIADGSARTGVEFVLAPTRPVTGRVLWPDGEPAAGCQVTYTYSKAFQHGFTNGGSAVRTDHQGQFEITELGQVPISIQASAAPSLSAGDLRARGRQRGPAPWLAFIEDVRPGTEGVLLTLREAGIVRGRVVDEAGSPVGSSKVEAYPSRSSASEWMNGSCDPSNGGFEIPGLHDGDWTLTATASGYAQADDVCITLPGDASSLVLVLRRPATVSGILVDDSGNPVPNVGVSVLPRAAPEGVRAQRGVRFYSPSRSDEKGLFTVSDVQPGSVMIQAKGKGWTTAAATSLELQPGQSLSGLRLTLIRVAEGKKNQ